ncbi:vWA domain-containing protein [Gorillibacterium massiliense]|uniref:vWA domain-containing protein n=1 Tax=Gorillibacterium massiliense TaxID=1280390 RepID=UPI0004B8AF50|nr:vWA domain-containing protein [Gorillibacterium massiliense]
MKQIILITDGCSNVGVSPVVAAAHALTEGIVVNVVGVIDRGEIGELGAKEIADIAKAGGGLSRIVDPQALSQTVQMMTRKTVAHTIRQAVGSELRTILGTSELTELPPGKRAEVVRVIDELEETADLRVALLVDASASMKPKLRAVREAVRDLMASLQARQGKSELAVLHFPGQGDEELRIDANWSRHLAKAAELFYNINMKGTTPTGPALLRAVAFFAETAPPVTEWEDKTSRQEPFPPASRGEDGMLSDYVL